jgi:hypothetical protein
MKAAVVTDFGHPPAVKDVPVPEPGPGEVLVRIETSGPCHTDIHRSVHNGRVRLSWMELLITDVLNASFGAPSVPKDAFTAWTSAPPAPLGHTSLTSPAETDNSLHRRDDRGAVVAAARGVRDVATPGRDMTT